MNDIIIVENPKTKHIKNLYLNDYNYYNKNNIKMKRLKDRYLTELLDTKSEYKKKNPMPKMLYSTFNNSKESLISSLEQDQKQLNMISNIANNFDFFEEPDNLQNESNNNDNIFITKTKENRKSPYVRKDLKEIRQEIEGVKVANINEIFSEDEIKEIKLNSKNCKTLDFHEKLQETQIKFNEEKKYLKYRKTVKYPNKYYAKIEPFDECFNKDLGKISNNYGKVKSRTRFLRNPMLKKYFDMVPIYETYKDIKTIENRYNNNRFKFSLLPLVNNKKRHLDALADKIYKMNHLQKGLENAFNINKNEFNPDLNQPLSVGQTKRIVNINKSNPKLYKTYSKDLKKVFSNKK